MINPKLSDDSVLVEIRPEYLDVFKTGLQIDLETWRQGERLRLRGEILSVLDHVLILVFQADEYGQIALPKGTAASLNHTAEGSCYRGECEVLGAQLLTVLKVTVTRPREVSRTKMRTAFRYETLLEDCALFQSEKARPDQWVERPLVITNISTGGAEAKSTEELPVGADAERFAYVMEVALPWELGVLTLTIRLLGSEKSGTTEKPLWLYRVQFVNPPAAGQDLIARYINRAQRELQSKGVAGTVLTVERKTGGAPVGLAGASVVQPETKAPKDEGSLEGVLGDLTRPAVARAYFLGTLAASMARATMLDPSPENVREATQFVNQMVSYVVKDKELFRSLIRNLASSPGLQVHSVNVTVYTLALGIAAGYKESEGLQEMTTGAFLHDLGKSLIPEKVLSKTNELSHAEWELVRRHANNGRQFAARAGISDRVILDVIQHHHERFDGRGYPDGLYGKRISPEAQIVAIADVFDALTVNRPWRGRYSIFKALVIMRDEMVGAFDRNYLRDFVQTLGSLLSG